MRGSPALEERRPRQEGRYLGGSTATPLISQSMVPMSMVDLPRVGVSRHAGLILVA